MSIPSSSTSDMAVIEVFKTQESIEGREFGDALDALMGI